MGIATDWPRVVDAAVRSRRRESDCGLTRASPITKINVTEGHAPEPAISPGETPKRTAAKSLTHGRFLLRSVLVDVHEAWNVNVN